MGVQFDDHPVNLSKKERIIETRWQLSGVRECQDASDLLPTITKAIQRNGRLLEKWLAKQPHVSSKFRTKFFQWGDMAAYVVSNDYMAPTVRLLQKVDYQVVALPFAANCLEDLGWGYFFSTSLGDSGIPTDWGFMIAMAVAAICCDEYSVPLRRQEIRRASKSGKRAAVSRLSFPVYHPKDDGEANMPLHWVRPHKAEYGVNGKGLLFGKHATTVSVAGHWRGNPELGFTLNPVELEGAA